jgi:hypothetical protein
MSHHLHVTDKTMYSQCPCRLCPPQLPASQPFQFQKRTAHQGVKPSAWTTSIDGMGSDVRGKPRTARRERGEADFKHVSYELAVRLAESTWMTPEYVARFIARRAIVEFHAEVCSDNITAKLNKI